MKKQILTILLGAFVGTMASETVVGKGITVVGKHDLSCDKYSPDFVLSTQGHPAVNGFKIYAYFANTEDTYPNFNGYSLEGGSVTYEEMNSRVFRAVIDYSNATIPANSVFPPQTVKPKVPAAHFKYFSVTWYPPFNGTGCWMGYPYEKDFHNIVIESKGKVIFGKHPDFKSRVGVLGAPGTCPGGINKQGVVWILLDTEDSNDKSGIVAGDKSFPYVVFEDGKSEFRYCAVEYSKMPRVPYDYVVLQLDNACPDGTFPFSRHHDTEDSNNKNASYGFIWRNVVNDNADLKYCFVPADKNSKLKYPLGENSKFGVFANVSSSSIAHSQIKIDDEDNNNGNSWNIPNANRVLEDNPLPLGLRILKIMNGSDNTMYHVIRLKDSALRKNSIVESSDVTDMHGFVDGTYVTAAPFAPAIKGLNRNAVAVELKSAGDVKVSIVGVDGAVIANVSEKNLQAGSHQINWNAGMVPNGRYIVKVEQNGMVNAKSVILK